MAYGFKLTEITIPENTTAINAVISDGTTPTEYALTGSVADGFSGTGISAVCTADGDVYDVDITVDAYTSEDVGDEYTINLSLPEAPTQAFKEAVEEVTSVVYEIPANVELAIMASLPSLFTSAVQSGKSYNTITLPGGAETALLIEKIATDVSSGKNVTVMISSGGFALKPIVAVVQSDYVEYDVLFYYTYKTYVFRVTIKINSSPTPDSNRAVMCAEHMFSLGD